MKTCSVCGVDKPRSEFNRRAMSADGLQPLCQPCNKAKCKAYYTKHQDRIREKERLRNAADPQANRDRVLAWQRANPEKHNAKNRESYTRDLDRARERSRKNARRHRQRFPERVLARNAARDLDATSLAYVTVLRRDPCSYCGSGCEHIDHIDAFSGGGENHWTNFTAACGHCNQSKRHDSLLTFLHRRNRWQTEP